MNDLSDRAQHWIIGACIVIVVVIVAWWFFGR